MHWRSYRQHIADFDVSSFHIRYPAPPSFRRHSPTDHHASMDGDFRRLYLHALRAQFTCWVIADCHALLVEWHFRLCVLFVAWGALVAANGVVTYRFCFKYDQTLLYSNNFISVCIASCIQNLNSCNCDTRWPFFGVTCTVWVPEHEILWNVLLFE